MSGVRKDELRKVPYIEHVPQDGRTVFLQPFVDKVDNRFKMFVPQGDGLTWIFAEPVESCYFAENILDKDNDIYLKIIDLIVRHFSFGSTLETLLGIIRDIENCCAVVEKYFIFLDLYRSTKDALTSNLVTTDLEFLFGNIRSIYDLLQKIIQDLWERASRKKLPPSFYQMASREPKDLVSRYGLPEPLAQYYAGARDVFIKCREVRDNIHHRGLGIPVVFSDEDGFAFQKDNLLTTNQHLDPITSRFDIWPESKAKKNGLVSVLALISYMNIKLIESTNEFSIALSQSIQPLPPISQSYKVFLRGPYIHHLLKSHEYLEKQWVEPPRRA
jgi:hypothetical protein